MLREYNNNFNTRDGEAFNTINNEIMLVLKNTIPTQNIQASTFFSDFENNVTTNHELNYIKMKINNTPLINLPDEPEEEMDEIIEDKKEEVKDVSMKVKISPAAISILTEGNQPNFDVNYLEKLVCGGIHQAMKEIIDAVIRRVIPIAAITTRSLVLKDFALEPDPKKMRDASHSTVKSLAGMLAQITCKDILKYQFMREISKNISS